MFIILKPTVWDFFNAWDRIAMQESMSYAFMRETEPLSEATTLVFPTLYR